MEQYFYLPPKIISRRKSISGTCLYRSLFLKNSPYIGKINTYQIEKARYELISPLLYKKENSEGVGDR